MTSLFLGCFLLTVSAGCSQPASESAANNAGPVMADTSETIVKPGIEVLAENGFK